MILREQREHKKRENRGSRNKLKGKLKEDMGVIEDMVKNVVDMAREGESTSE